jgi:lactate dehydrogenase-like 2-hydroxyacid dehydrogenase
MAVGVLQVFLFANVIHAWVAYPNNSDVLSLHCPLNEQTRGLMNHKTIKKMKINAMLIITARGALGY